MKILWIMKVGTNHTEIRICKTPQPSKLLWVSKVVFSLVDAASFVALKPKRTNDWRTIWKRRTWATVISATFAHTELLSRLKLSCTWRRICWRNHKTSTANSVQKSLTKLEEKPKLSYKQDLISPSKPFQRHLLNRHIKLKHTEKERIHFCSAPTCNKSFFTISTLKKHVESHRTKDMPCGEFSFGLRWFIQWCLFGFRVLWKIVFLHEQSSHSSLLSSGTKIYLRIRR